MPPSKGRHVFFSGRFDGAEKEQRLREIEAGVKRLGWSTYSVSAVPGEDFGVLTERGLNAMHSMVAVAFDNYGQKTDSSSCTYFELQFAQTHFTPIIPLRFSEEWPPCPPGDTQQRCEDAAARLRTVFGPSLLCFDARRKSIADIAAKVDETLRKLQENGEISVEAPRPAEALLPTEMPPDDDRLQQLTRVMGILRSHAATATLERSSKLARKEFRSAWLETPKVALVGPSSAGKTMLLNALCGRLVLPSRQQASTLLPVHLRAVGPGAPFMLRFVGLGLKEALAGALGDGVEISGDGYLQVEGGPTLQRILNTVERADSHLRQAAPALVSLDTVDSWHAEIEAPTEALGEGAPYTFVDCPGGGEAADFVVGSLIQRALRHQLERACVAILVVKLDNATPLEDRHQLSRCLGGVANKQLVVAINAVDAPGARSEAAEVLDREPVRARLQELRVREDRRCAISARFLLARKLVGLFEGAERPPTIDLDKIFADSGFGGYAAAAREASLGDAQTLREQPVEAITKVLKEEIGLKGFSPALLAKSLKQAAEACVVPSLAEAGPLESELHFVYRTLFPTSEPTQMEVTQRVGLPQRVRDAEDKYTENTRFESLFAGCLRERPRLQACKAVEGVIREVTRQLQLARRDLAAYERDDEGAEQEVRTLTQLTAELAHGRLEEALRDGLRRGAPHQCAVEVAERHMNSCHRESDGTLIVGLGRRRLLNWLRALQDAVIRETAGTDRELAWEGTQTLAVVVGDAVRTWASGEGAAEELAPEGPWGEAATAAQEAAEAWWRRCAGGAAGSAPSSEWGDLPELPQVLPAQGDREAPRTLLELLDAIIRQSGGPWGEKLAEAYWRSCTGGASSSPPSIEWGDLPELPKTYLFLLDQAAQLGALLRMEHETMAWEVAGELTVHAVAALFAGPVASMAARTVATLVFNEAQLWATGDNTVFLVGGERQLSANESRLDAEFLHGVARGAAEIPATGAARVSAAAVRAWLAAHRTALQGRLEGRLPGRERIAQRVCELQAAVEELQGLL